MLFVVSKIPAFNHGEPIAGLIVHCQHVFLDTKTISLNNSKILLEGFTVLGVCGTHAQRKSCLSCAAMARISAIMAPIAFALSHSVPPWLSARRRGIGLTVAQLPQDDRPSTYPRLASQ